MNALSRTRATARLLKPSPSSITAPASLRTYASQAQEADPQLADYPRLPWVSHQRLSPKGWWDPQMRRNFGDTVRPSHIKFQLRGVIKNVFQYHENEDILGMWGPDAAPLPPNVALRWFSIAVASFVSFGFLAKYALVADRPAIPREYPFFGLVTELGGLEENQVRLPFR